MEREVGVQPHQRANFCGAQGSNQIALIFQDVVFKLNTKSNNGEKVILKGVSGAVAPGELLAMLGPSGSGKTTLLTALGGRAGRHHCLAGSITYSGEPFSSALKRRIGFVTQDDALHPHLTVAETLHYTALLRLPSALPRRDKAARAEAVMELLGLTICRDGVIGGPNVRGVSGGERKRVSIGQEMLIDPSLLLLDEPTTGLDASITGRIVRALWEFARGGKAVAMTIHQPSSRLFYMFDKLLLLSDGHPVYYGEGSGAMDYFARIGRVPAVTMNPADFLLDLANGTSSLAERTETRASAKAELVNAYELHLQGPVAEELSCLRNQFEEEDDRKVKGGGWCTSWWQQFTVLLRRALKERRHESFAGFNVVQVLAVAVLAGVLWLHSRGHAQDQVGLLFFVTTFWINHVTYRSIFTFPLERTLLAKERASGSYRLSSYLAARMIGDLPMELVLPIVFICITYWMGGLKPAAASFLASLAISLLNVLVAQGFGLAIGALVMDVKAAVALASVLMNSFNVVGGFFTQNLPPFVAWVKYVSFTYYAFKLQIASQYSAGDTYRCSFSSGGRCRITDLPAVKAVGFDDRWFALLGMLVLIFAYRFVAYMGLMRVGIAN